MNLANYFKDKILYLLFILFSLFTIEVFLWIYNCNIVIKIYVPVSILTAYSIVFFIRYFSKKRFYNEIFEKLGELDQKYLIVELMSKAGFLEGNILYEILKMVNKSMLEHVNKYKHLQEEYKEYIELWIHEVKIPIATTKLIIDNNKNEITKSIDEEIEKIDGYIEQALFYARSNNVQKDYIIRKCDLKEIINTVIKKNKIKFITLKIKLDIKDVEREVFSDSKWIVFILNQIIDNSIKYLDKSRNQITIYSKENKECVILYIKDNGMGISDSDIKRVFEKGFTGSNGRINGKKSTGIGLYLCKKLCDRLRIGLDINSIENEGTEVKLIFPKNSFINF